MKKFKSGDTVYVPMFTDNYHITKGVSVRKAIVEYMTNDNLRVYVNSDVTKQHVSNDWYYTFECFDNVEDCKKYIQYQKAVLKWNTSKSNEDYAIMDFCKYLKTFGYSAEERFRYINALKKIEDFADKIILIKNGKVWYNEPCENANEMIMEKPKKPDNWSRSLKARRKWIEITQAVNAYNWYFEHKLLEV